MTYASADHQAFYDADEHSEEGMQQSLQSLIKNSHYLNNNNALARTLAIKNRTNTTSTGASPYIDKELFGKHYDDVYKKYSSWIRYCNFYGYNNFSSVQALLAITIFLNGSAFLIRKTDISKPIPLLLQVVSPKMLAIGLNKEGASRYVRSGIMYNKMGQVIKYAFYKLSPEHPNHNSEKIVWLDVQDVAHVRDIHHAGQGLTEPTATAAFLMINQWQDSQTIETKSRLSKIGVPVHYRTDPTSSRGKDSKSQKRVVKAGSHNEVEAHEVVFSPNRELAGNYQEHNLQTLRQSAMVSNVTYEQGSGDYSKTSFSSARMSRADQQAVTNQNRVISFETALDTAFKWFLDSYQVKKSVFFDEYDEDHYQYLPTWLWPQPEEIDPLKSAKSNQVKLQTGELTPRELAIQSGKNPDHYQSKVKDK